VVGLDIKPYTSWYQRGSPNMLYVIADARRPPLRPGSTDLMTFKESGEFNDTDKLVIREGY
jgi:hypothetical protein